ncbi:MAG: hypothetical protein KTR31_11060, partial [Myxococcales bacterium]|nr:hypothetical protein [Myxococcales bacterium]
AFDTAWMEPLGEVSFPREVQREHTVDSVTLQHGFVADTAGRLVLLGESRYESVLWSQELSAMP